MEKMKATGVIRRVDDLGRVVIPKEIRRTMRIRQGDTLEIYVAHQGELVFKKYSPLEDLSKTAAQFADAAYKTCGISLIVTSKDIIVACAGLHKADIIDRKISTAIETLIETRQLYIWHSGEDKIPVIERQDKYFAKTVMPIFSYGDAIGAVVVIGISGTLSESTETEIKLIHTAALFLGRQQDS
jgi:AbrB family transcriptional regulator (stage V sporulation protein T)